MTSDDRNELLAAVDLGALLVELAGIDARGHSYPCPSSEHEQTGKSPPVTLASSNGYGLWKCHVCGAGGTAIDALVARGSSVADAFAELEVVRFVVELRRRSSRVDGHTVTGLRVS